MVLSKGRTVEVGGKRVELYTEVRRGQANDRRNRVDRLAPVPDVRRPGSHETG